MTHRSHSHCRPVRIVLAAVLSAFFAAVILTPLHAEVPEPSVGGAAHSADELPEDLSRSDWQSIRAAYERNRHAVEAIEGEEAYQARNPGQQWTSAFDGRGVEIAPDHGRWDWGLQLVRWGFAGQERPAAAVEDVEAQDQRTRYRYADGLEEWYVNDQRGLEHGFTVHRSPAGSGGALRFELAVAGGLAPRIAANQRDVAFVDGEGETALTYSGLKVWDAEGRPLEAAFQARGDGLALRVEADGANYPITIDPVLHQQAYLKASNTGAGDWFGDSVAVSGDTVIVGAPREASNATGVDGDQDNGAAGGSGAAYVFIRDGSGTWSQQAYLKASNTGASDRFGDSVAVSGDTVVVGAWGEDSNATGVDNEEDNDDAGIAGAAYVFARDSDGEWSQRAYLKASNTDAGDVFGESVAISGETVVVGATQEDSDATEVGGDQGNNDAENAGAAYVFVHDGAGDWSQQAYLKASNTDAYDAFGYSVAVASNTIVVGARAEASSATGVDGNQGNDGASNAGAAYVFVRDGSGAWSQQAYLKASNTDAFDVFGWSVAVSGDTVVVGASQEGSNATGVDGNQSNDDAGSSGAAYVFVRSGTDWLQQAYLKASNTDAGDFFGWSVAVSGDTVVVGARFEDSNATGVNGDDGNDDASNSGAAYVFSRDGSGAWSQRSYLKASNTDGGDGLGSGDLFGRSVAVSGETVVVGAWNEDSNATGVDGNQDNDSATDAGAAYVFTVGYTIGGTVSGLEGDEVVLQNNGGDDLAVAANGSFTFATALDDLSSYDVTVATQPTDPSQTCSVTNGTGTLAGADVDDVEVACTTDQFTVGGTVAGLEGDEVVLHNNGGDDLAVAANGSFTFATALDDLSSYDVTVATQPTDPSQTCSVTNGTGTLAGADVDDVEVSCTTDQFTVGGTVAGLEGDEVVLHNNGGDDQVVTADGGFTFSPQDDGTDYVVTVATQPDGQFCSVANASGTLAGGDVDDVAVDCVDIELGLSLSEIEFSDLVLGQDEEQSLTLTNTGSADVVVEELVVPAAPFAVDAGACSPLPLTLAPGESCSLTVSFDPAQAGSFEDQLDVVSNAASSPDSVVLQGEALEPIPIPVMSWPAVAVLILLVLGAVGVRMRAV